MDLGLFSLLQTAWQRLGYHTHPLRGQAGRLYASLDSVHRVSPVDVQDAVAFVRFLLTDVMPGWPNPSPPESYIFVPGAEDPDVARVTELWGARAAPAGLPSSFLPTHLVFLHVDKLVWENVFTGSWDFVVSKLEFTDSLVAAAYSTLPSVGEALGKSTKPCTLKAERAPVVPRNAWPAEWPVETQHLLMARAWRELRNAHSNCTKPIRHRLRVGWTRWRRGDRRRQWREMHVETMRMAAAHYRLGLLGKVSVRRLVHAAVRDRSASLVDSTPHRVRFLWKRWRRAFEARRARCAAMRVACTHRRGVLLAKGSVRRLLRIAAGCHAARTSETERLRTATAWRERWCVADSRMRKAQTFAVMRLLSVRTVVCQLVDLQDTLQVMHGGCVDVCEAIDLTLGPESIFLSPMFVVAMMACTRLCKAIAHGFDCSSMDFRGKVFTDCARCEHSAVARCACRVCGAAYCSTKCRTDDHRSSRRLACFPVHFFSLSSPDCTPAHTVSHKWYHTAHLVVQSVAQIFASNQDPLHERLTAFCGTEFSLSRQIMTAVVSMTAQGLVIRAEALGGAVTEPTFIQRLHISGMLPELASVLRVQPALIGLMSRSDVWVAPALQIVLSQPLLHSRAALRAVLLSAFCARKLLRQHLDCDAQAVQSRIPFWGRTDVLLETTYPVIIGAKFTKQLESFLHQLHRHLWRDAVCADALNVCPEPHPLFCRTNEHDGLPAGDTRRAYGALHGTLSMLSGLPLSRNLYAGLVDLDIDSRDPMKAVGGLPLLREAYMALVGELHETRFPLCPRLWELAADADSTFAAIMRSTQPQRELACAALRVLANTKRDAWVEDLRGLVDEHSQLLTPRAMFGVLRTALYAAGESLERVAEVLSHLVTLGPMHGDIVSQRGGMLLAASLRTLPTEHVVHATLVIPDDSDPIEPSQAPLAAQLLAIETLWPCLPDGVDPRVMAVAGDWHALCTRALATDNYVLLYDVMCDRVLPQHHDIHPKRALYQVRV
jgi:hypothetical protein